MAFPQGEAMGPATKAENKKDHCQGSGLFCQGKICC